MYRHSKNQFCQDVSSSQFGLFNVILIKILARYFVDINKLILHFIWRSKRPIIANTILKNNNKVGRLSLSNLKTLYKDAVIKTVWCW